MTLTDFLLARIAEDVADAETACGSEWLPNVPLRGHVSSATGTEVAACSDFVTAHIARQDPGRVLAECEAKLRIADQHSSCGGRIEHCQTCARLSEDHNDYWPCLTVRLVTLPYADHPDYREEWKP